MIGFISTVVSYDAVSVGGKVSPCVYLHVFTWKLFSEDRIQVFCAFWHS